jgi:peptidoglycan/xylan/chitin deacetylase (PgdA/CDA1 family)
VSVRGAVRRGVNAVLAVGRPSPTAGRILLYHELREGGDPTMCVPPSLFARHREWIAARGKRVATISAAVDAGYPSDVVAVSFDDGYRSVVDACVALVSAGGSATVFVVPAWIDEGRADVCGWDDLASLARRGVEVAAHDLAHERPCGVRVDVLSDRYARAKARIEDRLGVAVRGLAYPYGLAPRRAVEAASRAGYRYAVTSEPGANGARTDAMRLRRNEIHATDDGERTFVGKLGGTDDWMRPIRALENGLACR